MYLLSTLVHEQLHWFRLAALDGVTAALELEGGVLDLAAFVASREGHTPIHFGATASHIGARALAWDEEPWASQFGPEAAIPPPAGPPANDPASPEQLRRILADLVPQIEAGALGIGVGLEYTPGATRHEAIELFQLAGRYQVPVSTREAPAVWSRARASKPSTSSSGQQRSAVPLCTSCTSTAPAWAPPRRVCR